MKRSEQGKTKNSSDVEGEVETGREEAQAINEEAVPCIDGTERKNNEESCRWHSAIVEFSTDAVVSFDLTGKIISWNMGAERIFAYKADEMIGNSLAVLTPRSLGGEKRELFKQLQRGQCLEPFETVRIRKDGQKIDVSLSASVIRNEKGEIVGGTAIARDISARKRAVKNLKHARDELEERVKKRTVELRGRIDELARMTSELTFAEERERKRMARIFHDGLQQWLVSAKMSLEALDGLDEEERKREVESLIKLMDELIEKSRSLSIDLSPPVLCDPLGEALNWLCLTWMYERYNLTVHTDIDFALDAENEGIRSIVFYSVRELLFNVVKHSEVLEACVELKPHIGGNLKVVVSDYGLGFDSRELAPKEGKATGFGLIGLRERLKLLGGSFKIRSQPGEGVEAVLVAPRKTKKGGQ